MKLGIHESNLLSFAMRHPKEWHSIAKDRTTQRAAKSLHRKGLIYIWFPDASTHPEDPRVEMVRYDPFNDPR